MMIRNKRGEGSLFALIVMLAVMMIATGVWEYMRLMIVAGGVRDAVQSAIISVATTNYDEVYFGLREGYSGGYALTEDTWEDALDVGDIYEQLDTALGLTRQGGRHVKYTGGVLEYEVWGLNVLIENAPFAPTGTESVAEFSAEATLELEVPLSFGWSALPPMRINLYVKAGYTPKF